MPDNISDGQISIIILYRYVLCYLDVYYYVMIPYFVRKTRDYSDDDFRKKSINVCVRPVTYFPQSSVSTIHVYILNISLRYGLFFVMALQCQIAPK